MFFQVIPLYLSRQCFYLCMGDTVLTHWFCFLSHVCSVLHFWAIRKCRAWAPFHGVCLKLTRHRLVTNTNLIPPLPQHILQSGQIFRSVILWLGWCPDFSFHNLQSTFPHQTEQNIGVTAPCRYQLNLSMVNGLWMLQMTMRFCCQFSESHLLS